MLIPRRNYGWRPDTPDQRDHAFKLTAPPAELPPIVDLRPKMPPVRDQLDLGCCTGFATAAAVEYKLKRHVTPSPLFIYYGERLLEGTIGSDAGAEIRDGIKTVNKVGVCAEAAWPYKPAKFARRPTKAAYDQAAKHRVASYSRVPADLQTMQASLAADLPIVVGFSVYASFESEQVAKTGVAPMPQPGEAMLGGHAVLVVGYDIPRGVWIVRNSWSAEWGDRGYFTLPFAYLLDSNLADDFWSISVAA